MRQPAAISILDWLTIMPSHAGQMQAVCCQPSVLLSDKCSQAVSHIIPGARWDKAMSSLPQQTNTFLPYSLDRMQSGCKHLPSVKRPAHLFAPSDYTCFHIGRCLSLSASME